MFELKTIEIGPIKKIENKLLWTFLEEYKKHNVSMIFLSNIYIKLKYSTKSLWYFLKVCFNIWTTAKKVIITMCCYRLNITNYIKMFIHIN